MLALAEMRGRTVELGDGGRGRVEHEDALAMQVLLHVELVDVRGVMHCHVLRRARLHSTNTHRLSVQDSTAVHA
jgi:hypothetical protein